MMLMPDKVILAQLRKNLSDELLHHSQGVGETAAKLALSLGCSESKAGLAGLLHDCVREWPHEKLFAFAREHGIETDRFALRCPVLLHAPVGAAVARTWGISDPEILAAIRNHTLGFPGMSLLEQIVYVADKIEPGRIFSGVEELRVLVAKDFKLGLKQAAAHSIALVLHKNHSLHPSTVSFWNWLVEMR
ncbi:MAG: bis(5'-nucleosyl)-tetraphosphatase (symmetrical) YqeK [Dethiobacter sp.]|nr:bis(5'-nucleosyl)-tetraphosphatase (symmetrical) YqeK [Dethiobacter sp.]MBS3901196.1 bis(5'-nucleosyl)-tetraphosphatase (symmetrical) YqeK [Dethiobacter sp.]MBS3989112.1 bis(5'-nucleosyl)-tetraphosphatase (symmetrical) YqeK [Dethiobacter sp.]